MDKEGSGAGKMAIPLTQRSICPNLCFFFPCATGGIDDDIYIFPQNYLLCHLKTPIWNWQLLTKTPLTNTPFRHAKSPKASFFLLNKKCRDFPHGLTPWDPFFWARSDRAAVAINEPENRAGWWRIEEEIEVKRSRSQDLERGRGCDQFSTPSPGHVGDTKSAWSWPVSLESKIAFSSTRRTILKVKGPWQTARFSYSLFF